jgi:Flp pilus assembly pilin Flp
MKIKNIWNLESSRSVQCHLPVSSFFQCSNQNLHFRKGQTLSEYALALSLVGVVAVVGLVNLSGTLDGLFDNMISTRSSGLSASRIDVSGSRGKGLGNLGGNTTRGTGSSSSGLVANFNANTPFSNLPGSQMEIDLGSKGKFTFNMADFKATGESTGGSGVTLNANALINQLLNQLEEKPELADPGSIHALKELSRRGYQLAGMQEKVQNLLGGKVFNTTAEKAKFVASSNIDLGDGRGPQKLSDVALYFDSAFYLPPGLEAFPSFSSGYRSQEFDQASFNGSQNAPVTTSYFMQQMEVVRNSKFMMENPVLRDLVINAASRQIFLSSLSTPYLMSGAEVGELAQTTDSRAQVICTASNNTNCKPR